MYRLSNLNANLHHVNRTTFYQISLPIPKHVQRFEDDISHINPLSPPPLHDYYAQVSEYARAISRYTQEPAGCV